MSQVAKETLIGLKLIDYQLMTNEQCNKTAVITVAIGYHDADANPLSPTR